MLNSCIFNAIDGVYGISVERCCYNLHNNKDISDVIIDYVKNNANDAKEFKIYIEDLKFLCNKEFLLYLYSNLDKFNFSIYVNDISFRDLIKCESCNGVTIDEMGYIKEELYINEQIINNDINYISDINFLNALYSANKNLEQDAGNKKLTFYFNTNNKLDKIFASFMDNIKKSAKRTNFFTINVKPVYDNSSALSESSGVLDFTVDVFKIEPLVKVLIDDLKEHVNKYNNELTNKYGINIQISDEKYKRIEESLIAIFNIIFMQAYNLREKFFFDTACNLILFSYDSVISSFISLLIKGCLCLVDNKYANKCESVLKRLLNNNILFYKFVEILGSDLLFLLNYQTGIKGARIDIDDRIVVLLPKLMEKHSSLPTYSIQFCLENRADNQEVRHKSKASIYSKNMTVNFKGNNMSNKELMLINNIKSLKYLLFIETPSYFLPYMDKLLKENFNFVRNEDTMYNTTGKDINVIVFTSLLNKWQENYTKNRINQIYGAVPVKYSLPSKEKISKKNIFFESYKDYDIILKNSAIKSKPVSKIVYLTYFNRIDVVSFQDELNNTVEVIRGIFDKLQNYVYKKPGKRNEYCEEQFNNLFTVFSELCKLSNISNIFKGFDNTTKFINKRKDSLTELKNSFEKIKDIYIEIKQKYSNKIVEQDNFPYEDISEINIKLDYFISMISSIEKYFFSKVDKNNIVTFMRDYIYNIDEFLRETILEKHICSIMEYRYYYDDSLNKINLKFFFLDSDDSLDELEKLLKYATLDTSKYDLSYIRYNIMRLHYNLDNNLKNIKEELKGSLKIYTSAIKGILKDEGVSESVKGTVNNNFPNVSNFLNLSVNIKYSELEDLGRLIWIEVNKLIEEQCRSIDDKDKILDSHLKSILVLKRQFLLHLFIDDDILSRYLYEYEDKLFYIAMGMYFSTKFHNHLLPYILKEANLLKKNMKLSRNVFITAFRLYCIEELYIIAQHLHEDREMEKSVSYTGHGYMSFDNIFELNDISVEYINILTSIIRNQYDSFDYLKKALYRKEDEYIHKNSISGYGSTLYKNYRGERSKYEKHIVDVGSPDFKLSVFDEAFNIFKSAKYVKILIKEKFNFSQVINLGLIAYGLYSVFDFKNYFKNVIKNVLIKTVDEKNIERYMNYIKYTHIISHKQPPLVKVSNNELILPGSIHNNMMLFDNTYSIFGGSALDLVSFVNNDAAYANIYDENITKSIFVDRIKKLILGINYNSNRLISDFWNSIEYIEPSRVSMNEAEKIADEYIKKNNLVNKRIEEYSTVLKNKKISVNNYRDVYENTLLSMLKYVFIIGYYIKYIVNNENREAGCNGANCLFESETERVLIYQLFTESLHGVGRCNLRSIYIDVMADVAEMSFEYEDRVSNNTNREEENNSLSNIEVKNKIRCNKIAVCHLDYVGMISILPIEDSRVIIEN